MGELIKGQALFPGDETKKTSKKPYFYYGQVDSVTKWLGSITKERWPLVVECPHYKHIEGKSPQQNKLFIDLHLQKESNENKALECMLHYDPSKRLHASQVLQHPYFKEDPLPSDNAFEVALGEAVPKYPPKRIRVKTKGDAKSKAAKLDKSRLAAHANPGERRSEVVHRRPVPHDRNRVYAARNSRTLGREHQYHDFGNKQRSRQTTGASGGYLHARRSGGTYRQHEGSFRQHDRNLDHRRHVGRDRRSGRESKDDSRGTRPRDSNRDYRLDRENSERRGGSTSSHGRDKRMAKRPRHNKK